MSRKHVFLACALVMLLAIPLTMAATTVTGVPGETTEIDVGGADPNLAGLAGHAQYEVTWFNGAPIYSRTIPVADGKEICAVPTGQATPVGQALTATATTYVFTDPNGRTWTTTKYTYSTTLEAYCVPIAAVDADTTMGSYNFAMIVDTDDLGTEALVLYVV